MVAIRNALKNRMHLIVNVLGLTIGLSGFIFTQILVEYEETHDKFFENADRTYGVYLRIRPDIGFNVSTTMGVQTALAPLMAANVEGIDAIARYDSQEVVIGEGFDIVYRNLQLVDPAFFEIFDFDFLAGDASQMDEPGNVLLSRSMANTIFGTDDAVGETLVVNAKNTLQVTGVFRDVPLNSHFQFSIAGDAGFDIVTNIRTYMNIQGIEVYETWDNLDGSYRTYVMLPADGEVDAITAEFQELMMATAPDYFSDFVAGVGLRPLAAMNNYMWETTNIPMLPGLQVFGLVLLLIAVLNYMNLAGAKALLRSREIGMRKVAGATKSALITQFVLEAILESLVALILAVLVISWAVPEFNAAAGKALPFNVVSDFANIAWLAAIALGVGISAGLYPAWVLSSLRTVGALNGIATSGRIGRLVSGIMVSLQFTFSITLIVAATIAFAQDNHSRNLERGFDDSNILLIERFFEADVREIRDQLKAEIERIEGVRHAAYSSRTPYSGGFSSGFYRTADGGVESNVVLNRYAIDDDFLGLYNIPLLAGRNLSSDISNDVQDEEFVSYLEGADDSEEEDEVTEANAVLSRLAVKEMGFPSPADAIGQVLMSYDGEDKLVSVLTIVGVTEDYHYSAGLTEMQPLVFEYTKSRFYALSVEYDPGRIDHAVSEIDRIWLEQVPTRPIERTFLADRKIASEELFNGITLGIIVFSLLATLVACIGLYALSAFLAERRTKEIGIRKVMGATVPNIMGRLTWRLAMPAAWGCLIGLPLGYFIADMSAQFVSDRVPLSPLFFIGPAILIIAIACLTVAAHTARVSLAHPINALRYE